MALINILNRLAAEEGLSLTDPGVRAYTIDKVNEACEEIYESSDLPVTLQECYLRVTKNWEMSLPPFVGELRAIRNGCRDYCTPRWVLYTMWPRYNKTEWDSTWNNWRIKGYAPYAIDYANTSPGTINYPASDSGLVVTINGQTDLSNSFNNAITMSGTVVDGNLSKPWTSTFLGINKITKNKITDYNVIIKDADGNELAIIYANQLEARYIIVDVSKYPQNLLGKCSCPDGSYIMEILFKPRLPKLINDQDCFIVDGFENVIILRTKQLLAELEEGQEQRAILMNSKSETLIKNKILNKQGSINRRFNIKRSPYYINWDYIPYGLAQNIGSF